MKKVLASVEGQTEETFIYEVLNPYLESFRVYLQPVIVFTKRLKQGNKFKGGMTSYEKPRAELLRLLQDTSAVAVTTLYDYYALPNDFPGVASRPPGHDAQARVAHIEAAMRQDLDHRRFQPYLQLHEFEALLFVNPRVTAQVLNTGEGQDHLPELQEVCRQFSSPEEINDGAQTAPSKRILALYPQYDKPLYGAMISSALGVEQIKRACPHFRDWVAWLESLGG